MTAAIRNNYSIVKLLFADGYKIFEKLADDRFFFTQGKKIGELGLESFILNG
jgi:hypothetical protein